MRPIPLAAAAASLVTLGFAGTVAAADSDPLLSGPLSGPYVGAGWGRFTTKPQNIGDAGTGIGNIARAHDDDTYKIFAGYRFAPFFALEVNYVDFGRPNNSFTTSGTEGNYRLHASGFAPMGVATLPLGPIELFAKGGWLFSNNNVSIYLNQPGQQVVQSSHSSSDFMWGGGAGITVLRHLNINAEWDRVEVENAHGSQALWLAAAWRF